MFTRHVAREWDLGQVPLDGKFFQLARIFEKNSKNPPPLNFGNTGQYKSFENPQLEKILATPLRCTIQVQTLQHPFAKKDDKN